MRYLAHHKYLGQVIADTPDHAFSIEDWKIIFALRFAQIEENTP